jgi:hypothetical protein
MHHRVQMTATSKLFVRESSMAPIYSLLLFGGELRVIHDRRLITVSSTTWWLASCTSQLRSSCMLCSAWLQALSCSTSTAVAARACGYHCQTSPTTSNVAQPMNSRKVIQCYIAGAGSIIDRWPWLAAQPVDECLPCCCDACCRLTGVCLAAVILVLSEVSVCHAAAG